MLNSNKFFFVGFIFSIFLYVSCLFALTHTYLFSSIDTLKFTAHKNDFLDVVIVEPKKASKNSDTNVPKGSSTNKQTPTSSIKNLFSSIDTSKIKTEDTPKTSSNPPSRLKGDTQNSNENSLNSLIDNLSIQTRPNYNASSTAQYDEYRGKIIDILEENWQKYVDLDLESDADVQITISPNGSFSYNIVRLSKNDIFNDRLKVYLEDMKKINFPLSLDGKEFKFKTKFSIKVESNI